MQWSLHATAQPMRTVLMVSKEGHCLNDLLFRWKSGLLPLDIRAIISNHRDFYQLAASYNVPFHHIVVTKDNKAQAEAKQFEIIENEEAELVVLARYMQILSDDLCRKLAGRAINIHHSFLPSFKGAKPYYQAHDRGVKLIGATAHYVTADLDEGPIIEQDVARVDHTNTVEDLTAMGRDTESQVLARAVKWHSEHRMLVNGHKTVIFNAHTPHPMPADLRGTGAPAQRDPGRRGTVRDAQRREPPGQAAGADHRHPLFGRADFSLTTEGSEYLAHVREGLTSLQKFPGAASAPGKRKLKLAVTPTFRARS
jgi:formyltetrahydrofolate deformylase